MQQKKQNSDQTPMSRKVMMAVVAVLILLAILYVLNDKPFPTDITFRNVNHSGGAYIIQRENP